MAGFETAIITILNAIGFFFLFITALLTSWEGLGIIILLTALIISKDKIKDVKNPNEIIFFVALFFLIWEGMGFLMGKSNNLFSSLFGKLIILAGFLVMIGLVFYLKEHFLNPNQT